MRLFETRKGAVSGTFPLWRPLSRARPWLEAMAPFANFATREIPGHRRRVHSVAWNCTGRKLASGSVDQTARVYDVEHGAHSGRDVELKGHSDSVDQVSWDPTSPDRLATVSADKTLRLWDIRSGGRAVATVALTDENINVTWSPDGAQVAVGNRDDVFAFVDAKTHKVTRTTHKFSYQVNDASWNRKGDVFYLTTADGFVEALRFPDLKPLHEMKGHTSSVYAMALDPVHDRLASGGADAMVTVWDTDECVCVSVVDRLQAPVRAVSFSHDGAFLASAGDDAIVDVADADVTKGKCDRVVSVPVRGGDVSSMKWSPTHHVLAFAGEAPADRGQRGGNLGSVVVWSASESVRAARR